MDTAYVKGDGSNVSCAVLRPNDINEVQLIKAFGEVAGEKRFSPLNVCHTQSFKVRNGFSGSANTCAALSTRFKLLWDRSPDGTGFRNGIDHLAAGKERRHPVEYVGLSPQYADAHGATHLVRREGQKIAIKRANINGKMRR